MSPITTHILDTSKGRPAAGVSVQLERSSGSGWETLARGKTNDDGRIPDLLPKDAKIVEGLYRLTFETGAYFKAQGVRAFYPAVTVAFEISELSHHHIPLLLSPFGYSTYRGS